MDDVALWIDDRNWNWLGATDVMVGTNVHRASSLTTDKNLAHIPHKADIAP